MCKNDCKDARKKSQKVLLTSQITTTKNLNTTRAPRRLKPQRMYRLHAQTNVKKTTRIVQIKMSVASYVVHSQITSDNLHASAPLKSENASGESPSEQCFKKCGAYSRNALYCSRFPVRESAHVSSARAPSHKE